jgi:hypothetical protein
MVLQTLDAELPIVASEAAIEIDCALRGKQCGRAAINRLADLLSNSVEVRRGVVAKSLMDFPTVAVVGRAVRDSKWNPSVRTVDELVKEAKEIAGTLRMRTPAERSRAFCVALARCAASYRQSVFQQAGAHQHRK